MNIAVIGMGGVGGYFGAKLARLAGADPSLKVYFLARGGHLEAIRTGGLELDTDEGSYTVWPSLATDDFGALPDLNLVLVCVKSYDLDGALAGLAPKVGASTLVLPLLNGVDIRERIRSRIGTGTVLPSCVYVGTHVERPGKVTQRGGACTIVLGPDPDRPGKPGELVSLLERAGIRHQWADDPAPEIWGKFLFIAAFGLVTARYGLTLDGVLADPARTREAGEVMGEIEALARHRGVALAPGASGRALAKAEAFPPGTKTSFQRDYERQDKPDERDLFAGTILRWGRAAGLPTPATEALALGLVPKARS